MSGISTEPHVINVNLSSGSPGVPVEAHMLSTFQRAQKADELTYARQISLSGDVVGSVRFDGSEDISIATAVERLTNEDLAGMLL